MKGDLDLIRREIKNLKKYIYKSYLVHTVHDKQVYLEEQLKNDM